MKIKRKPKKAYYAKEKDGESSTIVFAENASEAKQLFNITDCGEDAEYIYGIDREKFDAWDEIIDELDTIIAVDAVPVVRCQECELWNDWDSAGNKKLGTFVCSCAHWSNEDGYTVYTKPDDFCSYGDRRADNETD